MSFLKRKGILLWSSPDMEIWPPLSVCCLMSFLWTPKVCYAMLYPCMSDAFFVRKGVIVKSETTVFHVRIAAVKLITGMLSVYTHAVRWCRLSGSRRSRERN